MNKKLWQGMLDALLESKRVHGTEGGEFYFEFDAEYQILIDGLYALENQQTGEHTVLVNGVEYVKKEA